MTELEQLHKQIFNNSEVNQWAENCNKLKTEILTCIKEEIFDFVMHLIGQLNKKAEIINNIVGSTENIRCKLVDVTNKPIENDNRIKEITSETCEFKKEDEKPHVEIMEWVKNCNKELSCTRKEVQELKSQFNEKTILVDDLEKRIAKSIIKYGEINTELDTVIDNNNLLTLKVKDYDITIQNNDILIKHLKNDLSSAEEILKIQDAEIFERKKNKALHDAQLKKYKDTILDLEFEIKNHKELHNKLQIKYDELQNKNEDLNVKCSKQNKIIANHDNVTNDLNVKIISLEKTSRDKDSKIAEIMHKVTERDNELCECVKQKNCLQSALTMLTKSHSKLTTEFNELNEKHQKLTTQFNEQTETINSNKHNEKLWQEALNSVNKISKEKDADLERSNQRITQLTQELIDLKIKKNVHSSTQSDSELLQLYNIVNSSIESKANRVSNLTPDKENKKDNIKNNPVGKDAESNILQAKENPIIDTAEKEKEKSEKNPENLLKEERKQSRFSILFILLS
ncbi:Hypothetical protein CINCED_3A019188 [Cinara cedri]|nr:Hypothetical protein CINCED_3A019188 [Cinara cedri]